MKDTHMLFGIIKSSLHECLQNIQIYSPRSNFPRTKPLEKKILLGNKSLSNGLSLVDMDCHETAS